MGPTFINDLKVIDPAERFLRYVRIDTTSDPLSDSVPSTEKQKNLGKLLVEELKSFGIEDAHLDELGYVYASVPSNSEKNGVPVICFCSHMDTSPDCSGTGVKPLIHRGYRGQDLVLPDDTSVVITEKEHPDLKKQHGNDLITASGNTLLGADDKAGIAEIMEAVRIWQAYPEIKHGEIKILFTPDEEIGRGADHVNLDKLGADFAYTVDGETAGSIEDETFSADEVRILVQGIGVHPGFAKDKLVNALKIAAEIVGKLPKDRLSPETTSGREGFVHLVSMSGSVEKAELNFIVRDFDNDLLKTHEDELSSLVREVMGNYPSCGYHIEVKEQYRNMRQILDQHPQIMEIGLEGIRRAGLTPIRRSIRGGTDGSRLSFMGLPCPNIFAGGHAFHGKEEWISVQDMQAAVRTILHIGSLWEEKHDE